MGKWWLLGIVFGLMTTGTVMGAAQEIPHRDMSGGERARVEGNMDLPRLEGIMRRLVPGVKGQDGFWEMVVEGVEVTVIASSDHNRMRVIAPVASADQLEPQVLHRMMEANFTSALDVRYAIFQGVVWAAFLHPLDSLTERDLRSALYQVVTLVKTTGTSYSSSGLSFGGAEY